MKSTLSEVKSATKGFVHRQTLTSTKLGVLENRPCRRGGCESFDRNSISRNWRA
jgi:hypothetical protein